MELRGTKHFQLPYARVGINQATSKGIAKDDVDSIRIYKDGQRSGSRSKSICEAMIQYIGKSRPFAKPLTDRVKEIVKKVQHWRMTRFKFD